MNSDQGGGINPQTSTTRKSPTGHASAPNATSTPTRTSANQQYGNTLSRVRRTPLSQVGSSGGMISHGVPGSNNGEGNYRQHGHPGNDRLGQLLLSTLCRNKLILAGCVGFYLGVMVTLFVATLSSSNSDGASHHQSFVHPNQQPPLFHQQKLHSTPKLHSDIEKEGVVRNNNQPAVARKDEEVRSVPAPESLTKSKLSTRSGMEASPVPKMVANTAGGNRAAQFRVSTLISNLPASLPDSAEKQLIRDILQSAIGREMLPLQAIVEPPLPTTNNGNPVRPLPIRKDIPLETFSYGLTEGATLKSCNDLPNGWPVDHPKELDDKYGGNVNILQSLHGRRHEYARDACPVDLDPFLPWIHDSFPSHDGSFIEFVAHNKRRCRQDPSLFQADISALEPQVALLQSVPIQRVSYHEMNQITHIPSDWKATERGVGGGSEGLYRLSTLDDADEDGRETRFICQFHTLKPVGETVQKVILGETLSVFPYNYEHANYQHRRGQSANPMLTRPASSDDVNGIHNEQIWNAILHFRCPVPTYLQESVANGTLVDSDGIPSIYLDVAPIRTHPRENLTGYNPEHRSISTFDPKEEWGTAHVLPPVSRSGRWANIPVCHPVPTAFDAVNSQKIKSEEGVSVVHPLDTVLSPSIKTNYLTGCLWASASFSVRGEDRVDTSTTYRLLEWLTYHLDVAGFDQIIVYDNSEANTNETSLKPVTDLFPGRVVRIPWKHRVCNNNHPNHPNAGERSSQYAAEASCRIRYGPTTEWMIAFDTDEYLIPQGKYNSVRDWLQGSVESGAIGNETHILNFYSTRSRLNYRFTEPYIDDSYECRKQCKNCFCRAKRDDATFLETYCEPFKFPKPKSSGRAKKQLYRPDFVLNHFVHYAAVTRFINDRPRMPRVVGYPYERRVQELTEAFMIHAKTKPTRRTKAWKTECGNGDKCPLGFAWPHYQGENTTVEEGMTNEFGFPYNCYEHRKVNDVLAGKLRSALEPLLAKWNLQEELLSGTAKVAGASEDTTLLLGQGSEVSVNEPFVYNATGNGITDFDSSLPAVIVSKIQGNSTLLQVEQWLCLLKYAYNDRANHDIVLFSATSITAEEENRLRQMAAPAKFEFVLDNPGIEAMVADLSDEQREYLFQRCNVRDATELNWNTRCAETSSQGTTNMTLQYNWQAEFRSLHLWKHPALAKYKYMMWLDSDGFCTKVSFDVCTTLCVEVCVRAHHTVIVIALTEMESRSDCCSRTL